MAGLCQLFLPRMLGAEQITDQGRVKVTPVKPRAIGVHPAAKRGHHPADMLADNNIANAFLAELAVHIIHKNFGEEHGGHAARFPFRIQSRNRQRSQRGDHFKPAIHRIGNARFQIPMRQARFCHDRAVERGQRIASFIPGKKSFQQSKRHPFIPTGLLFRGDPHNGGLVSLHKWGARVKERTSCMNRKIATALLCAAFGLAATGCTRIGGHQGYIVDPSLASAIQPGVDNRESVEKTLGRPTWVSQFGARDYYYFSRNTRQYAFNMPRPSEQFVLRVRFDASGNVIAADQRGMEDVAKINPSSKKTKTLGRERGFFEELFGNIGQVGAVGESGGTADNPN